LIAVPRSICGDDLAGICRRVQFGRRLGKPAHAAVAKPGAGRVKHREQVPAFAEIVADIADNVPIAAVLGREEIAGPYVMAARGKRAPDNTGGFATDKNASH